MCAYRFTVTIAAHLARYGRTMARPPRIEVANGIYHVTSRGNERQLVFLDDHDRDRFLEILAGVARRYRWRVLCFCLMGNHYHLVVLTLEPNLATGMRQLNGVYAQWFNRRHDRDGHLFQGRYKAVLVQGDRQLQNTVRYVVRNPLRAGLARDVDGWRWTSHGATMGTTRAGVVAVSELLSRLGPDATSARLRYLEIVRAPEDPPEPLHPVVDGDEQFVVTHLALVRPSPEHPRASVVRLPPPLASLVSSRDDGAGIFDANVEHGYSLRVIAMHLGCSTATIHRRVRAYEAALAAPASR
jgi:putative transposase